MSKVVPDGWHELSFSDFGKLVKGVTYSSKDYSDKNTGYPFLTIKCISKNGGFSEQGLKFYGGKFKEDHVLKSGDIVFANTDLTRNGDIVGSPLKMTELGFVKPPLFSMDLSKVVLDEEKIDSFFFYYWMMQPSVKRFMVNASAGSTVLHLDTKTVFKLRGIFPTPPEQQKIASILTSVDEVIEKTQSQINKLQDLKKGTMNELLTRGIGHTEFKDSPVGRIPKKWEVKTLDSITENRRYACVGGPFGSDLTSKDYIQSGGVPVIRGANLVNSNGMLQEADFVFVSERKAELLSRNTATRGDLVFTQRGTLGQVSLIPQNSKFDLYVISQSQMKLTPNLALVNMGYLVNWVCHEGFLNKIKLNTIATGLPHINLGILKSLPIILPPLEEQILIAEKINAVNQCIESKKRICTSQKSLKRSLMQDLLTGKVRVTVH
jgi:type I restriction enzyme, S subunit